MNKLEIKSRFTCGTETYTEMLHCFVILVPQLSENVSLLLSTSLIMVKIS